MKSVSLCVVSALLLAGMAAAHAAEMEQAGVMRDYTDVVSPPDQLAYEAGVKSYNKCLAEHGFKFGWTAWTHETGDTYQYSYVTDPVSWAAFDQMHEQGKPCGAVWQRDANPHMKGETSAFMQVKPELSYAGKEKAASATLLEVTFFKLKPGHEAHEAFMAAAKKIAAAAAKAHWSNHYTVAQIMDADQGAPDFAVVSYAANWAEFGKDPEQPLWKMVAGVYGKDAGMSMRKSLNAAVQESWSHVDRRNADLSFTAAK
ncbi:MAG: hypothetical protein KGM46_05620 [Pseudomonadota bacterium]|jgi:hypothetical protein|nr:hypothetical protein [Xanthomonadaceae bacterium]MDE2247555.1 hypothetical protein [Xanthomonadaceae bacterium]MDE3210199.1 hypothetical protein [Pseudomonadota bacterium]